MTQLSICEDGFVDSGSSRPPVSSSGKPLNGSSLEIDREFEALISPLSPEEYELLKNQIREDGCLEPLSIWRTDDGRRVLLDGHNRYRICTDLHKDFNTVKVAISSHDHAKLWILEKQAGKRNLTDDQRAIIWNEIREQRSKIAKSERAAKANAARHQRCSSSVEITDKQLPKTRVDNRAAVAKEARLPENKLKQAQILKKHQPDLYKKVLKGQVKLRDTSKLLKKRPRPKQFSEPEFYQRLGKNLANLFSGVDERLKDLTKIKQSEWCSEAGVGIKRLLHNLDEVRKKTDMYETELRKVLKSNS